MPDPPWFWPVTHGAATLVAAPFVVGFVASIAELHRLSGIGSHPAWLGSMFWMMVAPLSALAAVVAYVAVVGIAMFVRGCVRRRRPTA
jgi:hypothetical protein